MNMVAVKLDDKNWPQSVRMYASGSLSPEPSWHQMSIDQYDEYTRALNHKLPLPAWFSPAKPAEQKIQNVEDFHDDVQPVAVKRGPGRPRKIVPAE